MTARGTGKGADADGGRGGQSEPEFEPELQLAALAEKGVKFVVIGMLGAGFHGAQEITEDVDVTPDRETRNLQRLAEVLRDLDAVVLDEDGSVVPDAPIDDQHLRISGVTHLRTRYGKIDIVINPAATRGYGDLVQGSLQLRLPGGQKAQVASLEQIIESKQASDRPKDRAVLPRLERLLRDQQEGDDG